jgi:eukaryotic-like serine/threonine-protein kinase
VGTPELVSGDRSPESGGERTRAAGDRVIGRYRLAEQVGEATDPTVWKAFDEVLRRPVAMLTFAPGATDVGAILAAASAASRVGDVRFAHVFDAADGPDGAYVVTEWPSDECLEDLLADGPLQVAHAVSIVAEARAPCRWHTQPG